MPRKQFILAIDQGTSSTKSLLVDESGHAVARGSAPLTTRYSGNGFVEQDPEEIYNNVRASVKACLGQFTANGFSTADIRAIGISNQRETFVVWDESGRPLHPAIVWQCKRSIAICEQLKQEGLSPLVQERTGLVIDPYFSATKLIWLFQNNTTVRDAVKSGRAFFGTIDTWLLYRFTGGKVYATDHTNASRTLLFNLHTLQWDETLIGKFGLTGIRLPQVHASSFSFGETTIGGLLGQPVPITALIGDSHAAAFGEGCFEAGTAKATLGTGCSILMNIGEKPVASANGMVTTICWSANDRVDYALEGVIVSCGATIEWLKNELQIISSSKETEAMAEAVAGNGGVYLVPAFSGLGSPHWQMERKASVTGIGFGTNKNHIVRAALESIPYQIMDVMTAMEKDAGLSLKQLHADGGMTSNRFVMQFIADLLGKPVAGIGMPDVSALGAAYLAGLEGRVFESIDALKKLNTDKLYYHPGAQSEKSKKDYAGWLKALRQYQP